MDVPADGARIRPRLSVGEAKIRAAAARAASRRVREMLARGASAASSAARRPADPAVPMRGEAARALLARCEATRGISRALAASATAAGEVAGERIRLAEAMRCRLFGTPE